MSKRHKVMICGGNAHVHQPVKLDGEDIEIFNTLNFFGSFIVDEGGSSQEIKRRLAMTRTSAISLTDI